MKVMTTDTECRMWWWVVETQERCSLQAGQQHYTHYITPSHSENIPAAAGVQFVLYLDFRSLILPLVIYPTHLSLEKSVENSFSFPWYSGTYI